MTAEGVGNAPTSARADPVFETGAASLYLPAFQIGTRERILTYIFGVRTAALYVLSYASKIHPGAPKARPGHYFNRARSLPAESLHPGKLAAQVGFAPTPSRLTGG